MWSLLDLLPDPFMINVLDIGAALADQPSYQRLVERGRARIIGFEPNPAECERLNRTYGAPHSFYPYFVGSGGPATFHETNWNLTGSLFEPNTPLLDKFNNLGELTRPVAQHPVNTTRLDDVREIDDVDFIKIDIQGAELSVFENAPRLLAQTALIQTEVEFVPLYKNQPLFAEVDICLRRAGFQFHTFLGFGMRAFKPLARGGDLNQGFRQFLWSDAIYVRDWMQLEAIPTLKLKKYAVLVHDILESFDLCHLLLEEIDRREQGNLALRYLQRHGVVGAPPV